MSDIIEGEYRPLAVREEPAAVAIMPTVSPAEARAAMEQYQAVCEAVLTPDDYQTFKERGKEKRFKKKSAVKKLQTFWSVSVTVRDVVRDDLGDGHFGFRCIAVASMPSGRTVESTGGCSTFEERFDIKPYDDESPQRFAERAKKARARSYHDVMSTAETRATNRAVMNCIGVGGGEVTADEISRPRDDPPPPPPPPPTRVVSTSDLKALWVAAGQPAGTLGDYIARTLGLEEPPKGTSPAQRVAIADALERHRLFEPRLDADEYTDEVPRDTVQADPRENAIKRHHILAKEKKMPDEVRRAIIERIAGKTSSKELTFPQLVLVNGEIERWKPA